MRAMTIKTIHNLKIRTIQYTGVGHLQHTYKLCVHTQCLANLASVIKYRNFSPRLRCTAMISNIIVGVLRSSRSRGNPYKKNDRRKPVVDAHRVRTSNSNINTLLPSPIDSSRAQRTSTKQATCVRIHVRVRAGNRLGMANISRIRKTV
jgi:hypothetical protein